MNTYTSSMRDHVPDRIVHREKSKPWVISFALKVILMCAFIFGAVTCRIMYSAKIEKLNKQMTRLKMQIQQTELEVTNLRNRKEALSAWPEIRAKMAHYRLDLHPAMHTQITYVPLQKNTPAKRSMVRKTARRQASGMRIYAQNKRR